MSMVKLRLVHGDNYRYNHPQHGWGVVRSQGIFDVDENYAEALLTEGEQVRDDLFVPRFEKVTEIVVDVPVEFEKDVSEDTPEPVPKKVAAPKKPAAKKAAPRKKKTTG